MNVKSLTDTELSMFFSFIRQTTQNEQRMIRYDLICSLMAFAGLRIGEVLKLKKGDLINMGISNYNLDINEEIAEKGAVRVVPLPGSTRKLIERADRILWFHANACDYAFATSRTGKPITARQVERFVKQSARFAIARNITPHTLRHTFATRVLRVSNTRVVQQLLGHKHLSSTEIYTHPSAEDVKAACAMVPEL